jgi:hypothetical protein
VKDVQPAAVQAGGEAERRLWIHKQPLPVQVALCVIVFGSLLTYGAWNILGGHIASGLSTVGLGVWGLLCVTGTRGLPSWAKRERAGEGEPRGWWSRHALEVVAAMILVVFLGYAVHIAVHGDRVVALILGLMSVFGLACALGPQWLEDTLMRWAVPLILVGFAVIEAIGAGWNLQRGRTATALLAVAAVIVLLVWAAYDARRVMRGEPLPPV